MTGRVVRVVAPSRLHFGMISVNPEGTRHFGGVGAMIASPGLEVVIRPAACLQTQGPLASRAAETARRAAPALRFGAEEDLPCRIEILRAPPQHVGLGTGTQLSMAVTSGLNAFFSQPPLDVVALAHLAGRGERSAIGLHGFAAGGLLYEAGKTAVDEVAPLVDRVPLPEAWRFVLICPAGVEGLSGEAERRAFATLPSVPEARAESLRREAVDRLLPAARGSQFDEFSESLYSFGYLAGLSFAAEQGGPFAGPRLMELVRRIRQLGVRGVGQSSWGPTLFALLPSEAAALEFVDHFRRSAGNDLLELQVAAPDNHGARIEIG